MAADPVSRLARRLHEVERQVRHVATTPQLAYSSVEDGAIEVNAEGETTMVIGQQFDGTNTAAVVAGPVPPTPTAPLAGGILGGLRLYWDGTFEGGAVAPMDFARVTVHALPLAEFVGYEPLDQTRIVGSFDSARGGESFASLPYDVEHAVYLVAWSQAGRPSAGSAVALGTPRRAGQGDIDGDLGGAGSDGAPPTESPTPEVIPGYGTFYLRWPAVPNNDPVTYDVHILPDDPPGENFESDGSTLYASTEGTAMSVKRLPEASAMEDKALRHEVDYRFRVVARDVDGAAPAGAEARGQIEYITNEAIAAQTITGDRMTTNTLYGELFSSQISTATTFTTGSFDEETGQISGARSEMGPAGIDTVNTAGRTIFHMPTDGNDLAYVRANLEAETLRVLGGLSIEGFNNQIAQEARVTLAKGISTPVTPITLSKSYPTTYLDTSTKARAQVFGNGNFGTVALNPNRIRSMTWDPRWECWIVMEERPEGVRRWRFDPDGSLKYWNAAEESAWLDDFADYDRPSTCFHQHGVSLLVRWRSSGEYTLFGFTQAGEAHINRIPASWTNGLEDPPILAFDHNANEYILAHNGATAIFVRKFKVNPVYMGDATSLATYSLASGTRRADRLTGFAMGNGITGNGTAGRFVYTSEMWYGTSVTATAPGSARLNSPGADEEFLQATLSLAFAFIPEKDAFFSVNANGQIIEYSNWTWLGDAPFIHAGYTMYDPDPAGEGLHETDLGGHASLRMPKRGWVTIRLGAGSAVVPNADTGTKRRIYLAQSATSVPPAASQYGLLTEVFTATAASFEYGSLPAVGGPPDVRPFPNSLPAVLDCAGRNPADSLPTWWLTGSGDGRMGPWEWDEDGKDVNDTGWINAVLVNGWTAYIPETWGPPGYRREGNKVKFRGMISGGTPGSTIFTLPVGFRPPYSALHTGIVNGIDNSSGGRIVSTVGARLDVNKDGQVIHGNPLIGTGYVSLADIWFYIN